MHHESGRKAAHCTPCTGAAKQNKHGGKQSCTPVQHLHRETQERHTSHQQSTLPHKHVVHRATYHPGGKTRTGQDKPQTTPRSTSTGSRHTRSLKQRPPALGNRKKRWPESRRHRAPSPPDLRRPAIGLSEQKGAGATHGDPTTSADPEGKGPKLQGPISNPPKYRKAG